MEYETTPGGASLMMDRWDDADAEFEEEDEDSRYAFAKLSHMVLDDESISAYAKLVYCVGRRFVGPNGPYIHPSYELLAKRCGVSRRTVINAVQELASLGLWRISPRTRSDGGRSSNKITYADPLKYYGLLTPKTEGGGAPRALHEVDTSGTDTFEVATSEVESTPPPPPAGESESRKNSAAKLTPSKREQAWLEFRAAYPKRDGGYEVARGKEVYLKLLVAGESAEVILGGLLRYREWAQATDREGTPYVQQIPTWLRGRGWEEEWTIPQSARHLTLEEKLEKLNRECDEYKAKKAREGRHGLF